MRSDRHLTPEQRKEKEYWMTLKSTINPDKRFELMMKHAGGQCEAKPDGERCLNRHGENGITLKGRVILTPRNGPKPFLHCQKCGFAEVKEELAKPVHFKNSRPKKQPLQTALPL